MSIDKLLKAMIEYVGRDRALIDLCADEPNRKRLRAELDAAARVLESELQAYSQERSRPGAVKSILVAVDDSEPAQWAMDEAVMLAEGLDARVSLVHVVDVSQVLAPEVAFEDAIRWPALAEVGREVLRGFSGRVPTQRLGEQIVRDGKADKEIIATAQQIGADLLVIGTHGRGLLGRFLLGSVAEAVVRHATCPVLMVGHPRQGAAPATYVVNASAAPVGLVQGV